MSQAYSDPTREDEPTALPDVEIWRAPVLACIDCGAEHPGDLLRENRACPDEDCLGVLVPQSGPDAWWWWSCFPGCLPDGDPHGPFASEADALTDAQDQEE